MWGTVLPIALWLSLDPTRLVVGGILMSRPRPRHNLLAYWWGGMTAGLGPAVGAFVLLRNSPPTVMEDAKTTVMRFTGAYFQIAVGVLALAIATGVWAYRGAPSSSGQQLPRPTAAARLTARIRRALQGGNPWVAFGIGLMTTVPLADYLVVLIIIASSRAAIGAQLGAVVIFIVVVLALVEVPLVSYLVAPAQTQQAMVQLQRWFATHRRRLLIAAPALAGIMLLAAGVSSL
ncbi:hypothetical protein A5756_09770 [Mycobacterium sp. 852002-53434_SCH5985345]|nr:MULTISPECIES: GAP family protein [unclassified Mycobacterium]OBF57254.1 hypothetical protein A5756_09770 [Mycobacterium sp. 852002-53434_SCH5985345]OBF70073.1 hypothetical protein A5750_24640 [Mycobacterium sp. 852002-51613_SCH5001154]OBF95723.1 hypothetical protein A5773_13950 [Mycobacterium sp. 852014-52450_SCH5900713]